MQVNFLEDFLDYVLVTGQEVFATWRLGLGEHDIRIFHDSIERAQANGVFLDALYDAFMESIGEVYSFSNVDMKRIKRKLSESLKMIAQLDDGESGYDFVLVEPHALNARFHVTEGMYQLWLDALLKAVSRCDPHFNNYLEEIWRQIVRDGPAHIMKQVSLASERGLGTSFPSH